MESILYTPTIDPPTGALSAFLNSGLLSSVPDIEQRNALASLPSQIEDGEDDEQDALAYTLSNARPILQRKLAAQDFAAVLLQTGHYWAQFGDGIPWHSPSVMVRVPTDPETQNMVSSRLQMMMLSRSEVNGFLRFVIGTRELLEEKL